MKAEGVWFSTVTCSRTSKAWNSSNERATSLATTTALLPYTNAPNSSHTEKSKEYEWNTVHTSLASNAKQSWVAANNRTTLPCGSKVPLGLPVEPEV
ncbi:hypothetical protein D3C80_2021140 [compost metagenome]